MPDLDSIHYKFFPKSKTAPMGKRLIYFAWGIEILVALVGLSMAMLFFFSKGQSGISSESLAQNINLDSYIVGLAFIVVAIMELTKIGFEPHIAIPPERVAAVFSLIVTFCKIGLQ